MILQLLIAWLATRIHHHQDQVIDYLREENRILKATCKGKRMPLTDQPRENCVQCTMCRGIKARV